MPILALLVVVVAGLGGYLYASYGTLSPCAALQVAYREDAERIRGEMAAQDPAARQVDIATNMGRSTPETERIAAVFASRSAAASDDTLHCAGLVATRAYDPDGFAEQVAAEFLAPG